jgi:hypothetical protein
VTQELPFLTPGDTKRVSVAVSPEAAMLATSTTWDQAMVDVSLEAPDGTIIDSGTEDPAVRRHAGQGYELYEIDHPEPGLWAVVVTGVAVPAGGETIAVTADPVVPPPPDEDEDGATDSEDNCQSQSNPGQSDIDSDGLGDVCDPDIDNDSVPNASDNCPDTANGDQVDLDGDGLGHPCDADDDNDGMRDAEEALHACLSTSVDDSADDPDADGLVNLEEVWLGTDPCVSDTDVDGCADGEELTMSFDPLAGYDVFDVPVPALADPAPNGARDQVVDIRDVLAVLLYAFAEPTGACDDNPNASDVDYDCDKNGDTVVDGRDYDRSAGAEPSPPWDAGPPDDVVDIRDVLAALAQAFVVDCSGPP